MYFPSRTPFGDRLPNNFQSASESAAWAHRLLKCESIPRVDITIPSLALPQIDDEESENQVRCRQTRLLWVQGHLAAVALLFPLE